MKHEKRFVADMELGRSPPFSYGYDRFSEGVEFRMGNRWSDVRDYCRHLETKNPLLRHWPRYHERWKTRRQYPSNCRHAFVEGRHRSQGHYEAWGSFSQTIAGNRARPSPKLRPGELWGCVPRDEEAAAAADKQAFDDWMARWKWSDPPASDEGN